MSAQTAIYPPVYKTGQFAFLAKPPPPPQKKRPSPNAPLPAPPGTPPPPPQQRPRSNTFSSIAAWAAHVQPGSPAPLSPRRRPSITSTTSSSRRPSLSRLNRRPSIGHGRAPSGSFIHIIDTPTRTVTHSTPSVGNFDLTALGYTSVFVHFPKTPTTPSPLLRQYQENRSGAPAVPKSPAAVPVTANFAFAHIPIPPVPQDTPTTPVRSTKKGGMKRFRSLSILRPRSSKGKGTAQPASPTKTTISTKSAKPMKANSKASTTVSPASQSSKAEVCAATIAKRKRAKYAYVRPPPTLANELAMMQFADGGSLESHAKRVMDAQAKAAAGSGQGVGVADVYRDGKGGMWWDADEEIEYAHLLGGAGDVKDVDADGDVDMCWEAFDGSAAAPLTPFFPQDAAHHNIVANKENHPAAVDPNSRRSSVDSIDSDLDPKYLLPLPENEDPRLLPVDDRVLASRRIGGPGMSVLSLPARPRRRAMHLCKPAFLVDVKAFDVMGPRSPVRGSSSSSVIAESKPRGKARRRPAPLKLANSNSKSVVVVIRRPSVPAVPVASPGAVERMRREFIEDSFAPPAPAAAPTYTQFEARPSLAIYSDASRAATPHPNPASKPAKSKTGVRGFFSRRGD